MVFFPLSAKKKEGPADISDFDFARAGWDAALDAAAKKLEALSKQEAASGTYHVALYYNIAIFEILALQTQEK